MTERMGMEQKGQKELKGIGKFELWEILFSAKDGEVVPLLVTGNSMKPFLLNRETVVYLERRRSYAPRRGDIVLYWRQDGVWVLHRVVRVRKDGTVRTNGDAQSWTEDIHESRILAHVVCFDRKGKTISESDRGYRFCVRIWMALRWIHGPYAWCSHVVHRLPYKLFPKYMAKRNRKDGLGS